MLYPRLSAEVHPSLQHVTDVRAAKVQAEGQPALGEASWVRREFGSRRHARIIRVCLVHVLSFAPVLGTCPPPRGLRGIGVVGHAFVLILSMIRTLDTRCVVHAILLPLIRSSLKFL